MNIQKLLESLSNEELNKINSLLVIEKRKRDKNYVTKIVDKIYDKIINGKLEKIMMIYNNTMIESDKKYEDTTLVKYIKEQIQKFIENVKLDIYELTSISKIKININNKLSDFIFHYYKGGQMGLDYSILFLSFLYHNKDPKTFFSEKTLDYFYKGAFGVYSRDKFLDFNDLVEKFNEETKKGINVTLKYNELCYDFNIPTSVLFN